MQIRDIVMDFHACRYAQCLRALQQLTPTLLLDMHLSEYVQTLLKQVGDNCMQHQAVACSGMLACFLVVP
jgi:hypothetical protein